MKRILVVDDITENRYLLEAMLQAYGYEVILANNGAEALTCARRQPPDLIISDILMPVTDGFALCKRWRAEPALRDIPFIFYTATYTDVRDEQLAMDLGADRFVIKPQEPQVMHLIIQEVFLRGAKRTTVAAESPARADESVTLREYNEALVRKLEKKVAELESTRTALEADIRQRHAVEMALRRSEERWRLIYETEPECVKVVSSDGRLEAMNPAGLAMIEALSLADVCGKQLLDLVVPQHREAYLAMHRDVLGGQSRRLVFEVIGLNGTRRWLETHEAPLPNADGTISLLGITRDITELKQSGGLVNGQKQVLELIASGVQLAESLTALLRVVEEQTSDMLCSILLLDADGIRLRPGAAPSLPSEFCRAISDGIVIGPCAGSCGTAAFRREPVIVADIATDPLWVDVRDLALHHGLRACWSTPIFDGARRVLGTFAMYYRQPARPNEQQLRLIDMATHTAAIAITKHLETAARYEAETELQASENLLSESQRIAHIGSWLLDLNGRVIFSDETYRVLGVSPDTFTPSVAAALALTHPEDRPAIQAWLDACLAAEQPGPFEFRTILPDGTVRFISARGELNYDDQNRPCHLTGTVQDITERKHIEAELVAERNLLRTLVDHIPDYIFVKDTQSRQLLNNTANLRLIGAPTDAEAVGKTVFDLYPREQAQRYFDEDQRVMSSGQAQLNQEESVLDQDGHEHWLLSSKVPLLDAHGKSIGLVGIKRDITEHKRANTELAASRERLEMLSRQLIATQESERRHLARELHDEIGQALTGIKLNLKALQQPARASKSETLVSETIDLVDQTLQQVRCLALDLRPSMLDDIGLVAAVRWCLDRQSQHAGFTASFVTDDREIHVPPELAIACFRVAQESLTNISRHAQASHVRVELHQRAAELELLVNDNGCGFDVAAARHSAAQGRSLGVLGMEERVQLVGGQFEITSIPAGGTTIRARFPLLSWLRTTEEPT